MKTAQRRYIAFSTILACLGKEISVLYSVLLQQILLTQPSYSENIRGMIRY